MVVVSPSLVYSNLRSPKLLKTFNLLENDITVQTYLQMANIMAVKRLRYNDHGPVHSRITCGSALEIFGILRRVVTPTLVRDGVCDLEDAEIAVLCGAYLHDLGNAVHRVDDPELVLKLKAEVMHCIFAHDEEVPCLSVEAGCVKVADGTDMAEGRARIPYKTGKVDIHSLSALAIRRVEILDGEERPVRISVNMDNPAGVFQIEQVLERKIATSGIDRWIEVVAIERGKEIKTIPPQSAERRKT